MENKRTETNKTVQKRLEPELKLINMDTVEVEQIEWLLYPFIPYGKVTIIQGDPGEGKTTMVLQIIAKLTKGESILPVDLKKGKRIDTDSENDMVETENIENNAFGGTSKCNLPDCRRWSWRYDKTKITCCRCRLYKGHGHR